MSEPSANSMKAVVFHGARDMAIEEFPIPEIPEDKVLIKIEASAICTWEQRVYTGVKQVPYPFVGGHEMSGTIVKLGDKVDTRHWSVGDKVVVGVTLPCGDCYHCKNGNEQNCQYFNHCSPIEGLPYLGMGGFCTHFIVSTRNVFKFDNISFSEAALAEPLSCVVHSVETADIELGDTVVVIGCGIMGLLHVALACRRGASVTACDVNPERLALARKFGANYVVNSKEESLPEKVKALTNGIGAQVVFDTTPIAKVVDDATACLANNGRMILYSSFYPDTPVSYSPDWLHKSGAALMGTANSNVRDFARAARLLSEGIIDVKDLVSEEYPLSEAKAAFESSAMGDKFRVMLKM